MLRNAKSIEGLELHAREGAIGIVKDVYFDDERWHLRYFIVQTGSWLTGRMVLISPAAIHSPLWDRQVLTTELTREQVRNSPQIDMARPVSRQQELELNRYYVWPYYWTAPTLGTGYIASISPFAAPSAAAMRSLSSPPPGAGERERADSSYVADLKESAKDDPHLRSAHAVRGYHIEAADGSIGHVEDFLVEETSWAVRYLLVDTRNWWPGKKVLVPLSSITAIEWNGSTVRVDLTRDAIKTGPEFDPRRAVAGDYTDRLEAHYHRSREASRSRG